MHRCASRAGAAGGDRCPRGRHRSVGRPTPGTGFALASVADFNSDGKPDFRLFQTSTRKSSLRTLNGMKVGSGAIVVTGTGTPLVQAAGFKGPRYFFINLSFAGSESEPSSFIVSTTTPPGPVSVTFLPSTL